MDHNLVLPAQHGVFSFNIDTQRNHHAKSPVFLAGNIIAAVE